MSCTNCRKSALSRSAVRVAERLHSESAEFRKSVNLAQCYLCAKKHIVAAKTLFREYHTGYSDHLKNLIDSLRVAEDNVREAFIKWQDIMGELNMAEAELLGGSDEYMDPEHIEVANLIRDERIRLSDDTLYKPDFDELLVRVQLLQFS